MNVAFLENGEVQLHWRQGGEYFILTLASYEVFQALVQERGDTESLTRAIRLYGEQHVPLPQEEQHYLYN